MKPELFIFAVIIVLIWKTLSMIPIEIYIFIATVVVFILANKLYRNSQTKNLASKNPQTEYSNYVVPYDYTKDVLDVEVERIEPKQNINKSQNFSHSFPPNSSTYFITTVAGISYRKEDVKRFFNGTDHHLEFERDINNKHDRNAIKIIGISSGISNFIGFVPRDFAEQLVLSKLDSVARPYLQRIFCNSNNFFEVRFEVVGPAKLKQQFKDAYDNKPATSNQKDFYKFFNIPVPKKLTYKEADELIKFEKKRLSEHDSSSLDEYEAYEEIIEEFDDKDFRSDYEIKKPTKLQIGNALSSLLSQGHSYKSLTVDIDYVVDRLKELNPELDKN